MKALSTRFIIGLCAAAVVALAGSIAQGIHEHMAAWEWWKLGALALAAGGQSIISHLADPKPPPGPPPAPPVR